jgi:DNA repair exonuclease SbcCD ATPase subunit
MKVCSKCNIEKEFTEFYKDRSRRDGYRSQCKKCAKQYRIENREQLKEWEKQYRIENKEKIKEWQKQYRIENEEKIKEWQKQYRIENKEKINARRRTEKWREKNKDQIKQYWINNKEKIKECQKQYRIKNREQLKDQKKQYYIKNKEQIKQYYIKNKEQIKEWQKQYQKKRKQSDIMFKLKNTLRVLVVMSLKGYTKKSRTYEILGCSYEEFKNHIESQWEEWMDWDNHGSYNGKEKDGWDLDHVIPLASVNTEEEIIKLNHYTNFQPLCSHINRYVKKDLLDWDNLSKGSKIL